jgi:hypothetical protein
MPNVPEVALAGTVKDAGAVSTVAALLDIVPADPPVGAALDSVTVQVELPLAPRTLGVHTRDDTLAGVCKETVMDAADPLSDAVRVAVWSAARLPVEIPNVAEVELAGTVRDAGAVKTVAALLDIVTAEPPVGAALESVTVQVVLAFAPSALGVHTKDDTRTAACNETVVDAEDPLRETVSVAV